MQKSYPQGFSLIELMVALAVMGIVFAVGLPSMSTWIQNTNIRTATEAGLSGLQLARSEAVSRNTDVQIVFDATGGWAVSTVTGGTAIQARAAGETSATVTVAYTPSDATTVTFNGFGRVTTNSDGSTALSQVDFDSSSLAAADSRELRLMVGTNGVVRMCDPQVATGDPRAC